MISGRDAKKRAFLGADSGRLASPFIGFCRAGSYRSSIVFAKRGADYGFRSLGSRYADDYSARRDQSRKVPIRYSHKSHAETIFAELTLRR